MFNSCWDRLAPPQAPPPLNSDCKLDLLLLYRNIYEKINTHMITSRVALISPFSRDPVVNLSLRNSFSINANTSTCPVFAFILDTLVHSHTPLLTCPCRAAGHVITTGSLLKGENRLTLRWFSDVLFLTLTGRRRDAVCVSRLNSRMPSHQDLSLSL